MITSIRIERLRGIREGELTHLTPLVILVGPNGCGKSTVLDGLLIGGHPVPYEGIRQAIMRHPGLIEPAPWAQWRLGTDGDIVVEVQGAPAASGPSVHDHRKVNVGDYAARTFGLSFGCRIGPSEFSVHFGDGPLGGPVFAPIPTCPVLRLVEGDDRYGQPPLHRLLRATNHAGARATAVEWLRAVLPTASDILQSTEANDEPVVELELPRGSVPAAMCGDGIAATVRLCLEMATAADGVVLLEEPEAHLHPAAIWQSAKVIWAAVRRGVQVVISTHSLELIDALLASTEGDDLEHLSLYSLALKDGVLSSARYSGEQTLYAREQIEQDLR